MTEEGRTAEGQLLKAAMLRHRPRWRAPQLATAASVSIGTVQNIVKGYRTAQAGQRASAIPDAAMLATLAHALGNVSDDDLRGIGREDAVAALAELRSGTAADDAVSRLVAIRSDIDALIVQLRQSSP